MRISEILNCIKSSILSVIVFTPFNRTQPNLITFKDVEIQLGKVELRYFHHFVGIRASREGRERNSTQQGVWELFKNSTAIADKFWMVGESLEKM